MNGNDRLIYAAAIIGEEDHQTKWVDEGGFGGIVMSVTMNGERLLHCPAS